MKRDMDVIRKLILYLESADPRTEADSIDIGCDDAVLDYHARLMHEASLIEIRTMRDGFQFLRLTWAGHEFADACRDDTIWKRTMRKVRETTQSVTFDVLLHLLKQTLTATLH